MLITGCFSGEEEVPQRFLKYVSTMNAASQKSYRESGRGRTPSTAFLGSPVKGKNNGETCCSP